MMKNVGEIDRVLRIVIGTVIVTMTALGHIGLWGLLGLVLIAGGVFRVCFLYRLLNLNTCSINRGVVQSK